MEKHKQLLDKEYEQLLTQFSKELEKLQLKHQEELGKRLKMNINTEKKLIKEVSQVKLSLKDHFCCQNFISFVYTCNTQCVCVKVAYFVQRLQKAPFCSGP